MLRCSWLEKIIEKSSHEARLTELNTSDDEIAETITELDYELWSVLDDCVCSAREQSSTRTRDARPARCHGWERSPWTFPVDMVSQGFQELDDNCVHESSTMLSRCRFDVAKGTEEMMA